MKFDVTLLTYDLSDIPAAAQAAESLGFDGFWLAETQADPFLGLVLAAEHTRKIDLGTGIAVAFPRSPTVTAMMAWNIAKMGNGRFHLGLGSQVKAHNVLRYGVAWEKPIKKMRETIQAIRALWRCWQTGEPLDYVGEFFKLQLMTPFFNPGPIVNPTSPSPFRPSTNKCCAWRAKSATACCSTPCTACPTCRSTPCPTSRAGLAKRGLALEEFEVITAVFAIPTDDPAYAAWAAGFARQQIAFYLSTPAYRVVAEMHGWQTAARDLSQLARSGQWQAMPALITDDMLSTIAVTGTWAELPAVIHQKYGGLLNRVSFYLPFVPGQNDAGWQAAIKSFSQLAG
jgi:probable F420-dependent oxidoreductase